MTKRRIVTDEQYGDFCRTDDDLRRRVREGTINPELAKWAVQQIAEGNLPEPQEVYDPTAPAICSATAICSVAADAVLESWRQLEGYEGGKAVLRKLLENRSDFLRAGTMPRSKAEHVLRILRALERKFVAETLVMKQEDYTLLSSLQRASAAVSKYIEALGMQQAQH